VDLVRQVLKSCGMSCTVQKIAPARMKSLSGTFIVVGRGTRRRNVETKSIENLTDPSFRIRSRPPRSRALLCWITTACPALAARYGYKGRLILELVLYDDLDN
jgi:hypothetical protein